MPTDSISEHPFLKFSWGACTQTPLQCTLQLHTMLTTLTQNLPDQSKFASYTPVVAESNEPVNELNLIYYKVEDELSFLY